MVYSVSQDDHFKKGFAAAVYDSIVSQALRQVREDFSGSFLAVVVCAGWHAEVDAKTSMKEAFCAKQLAMCRTTIDLMRWAKVNSDVPMHFNISLSFAPKVLYHSDARYALKQHWQVCGGFSSGFECKYYNDQMCQEYLKDKLGHRGLEHYRALVIAEHRAYFFACVLLFFEGGAYLDMNSCLTTSMDRILRQSEDCSFLSCISAAGHFVHSGILVCPAGHPLLHRAIHKVLETSLSSPGVRHSAYITICQHLWDMLSVQTIAPLTAGKNATSDCGFVWLMMEQKKSEGTILIHGRSNWIYEHVATQQVADCSFVDNRCEFSTKGSKPVRHSPHINSITFSPASLVVNDSGIGVRKTVSSTNENLIALERRRCPHHYRLLTPDELPDGTRQGLIATDFLKPGSSGLCQEVRALTVAIALFLMSFEYTHHQTVYCTFYLCT